MNDKNIKRLDGENESQCILRICSMKEEEGWTWQDIADILNKVLGHEFGESAYRKKYQQFNKMLNDNEDIIFTDDAYLKQIEQKKRMKNLKFIGKKHLTNAAHCDKIRA